MTSQLKKSLLLCIIALVRTDAFSFWWGRNDGGESIITYSPTPTFTPQTFTDAPTPFSSPEPKELTVLGMTSFSQVSVFLSLCLVVVCAVLDIFSQKNLEAELLENERQQQLQKQKKKEQKLKRQEQKQEKKEIKLQRLEAERLENERQEQAQRLEEAKLEQERLEQEQLAKFRLENTVPFDLEVSIESFMHFGVHDNNPWLIRIPKEGNSTYLDKVEKGFTKALIASVQGAYGSGKTFFLHLLYGVPLHNEGDTKHSNTFCFFWVSDKMIIVDTAGVHTPCNLLQPGGDMRTSDLQLIDKKTTESILTDTVFDISDYCVVVIKEITWPMQEYIQTLRAHSPAEDIFLVHNWRNVKSEEERQQMIQEQIVNVFNATENIPVGNSSEQEIETTFYYTAKVEPDREDGQRGLAGIRHICLMNNDAPAGNLWNMKVAKLVKQWIAALHPLDGEEGEDPLNKVFRAMLGVHYSHHDHQKEVCQGHTVGKNSLHGKGERKKKNINPIVQKYVKNFEPSCVNFIRVTEGDDNMNNDPMKSYMTVSYNGKIEQSFALGSVGGSLNFQFFEPAKADYTLEMFRIIEFDLPGMTDGLVVHHTSPLAENDSEVERHIAYILNKCPASFVLQSLDFGKEIFLQVQRSRDGAMIGDARPAGSRIYGAHSTRLLLESGPENRYMFTAAHYLNGILRIIAVKINKAGKPLTQIGGSSVHNNPHECKVYYEAFLDQNNEVLEKREIGEPSLTATVSTILQ